MAAVTCLWQLFHAFDLKSTSLQQFLEPSPAKNKEKFNLLYTSFILGKKTDVCLEQCVATRKALIAGNSCAARIMTNAEGGSKWKSLVITNLKKQGFPYNERYNESKKTWDGPGPFPHYAKIHVLEQLFNNENSKFILSLDPENNEKPFKDENIIDLGNNEDEIDWILWIDADMRIMNASFPISKLIDNQTRYEQAYYGKYDGRQADTNEVSFVIAAQYDYNHLINNEYLIKNNIWGKRFTQAWKYFTTEVEQDGDPRWKTCGFFDQCPFAIAMLQVVHDYHWWVAQEDIPLTELLSRPYNLTLEEYAFRKGTAWMHKRFKTEMGELTGVNPGGHNAQLKENNIPLQIGPVLLVPTWKGGVQFPLDDTIIPSSISIEPTNVFNEIFKTSAWPFAIHAKYSRLFCRRTTFDFERQWNKILFGYNTTTKTYNDHNDLSQCTASERVSMTSDIAHCYARWKTSTHASERV